MFEIYMSCVCEKDNRKINDIIVWGWPGAPPLQPSLLLAEEFCWGLVVVWICTVGGITRRWVEASRNAGRCRFPQNVKPAAKPHRLCCHGTFTNDSSLWRSKTGSNCLVRSSLMLNTWPIKNWTTTIGHWNEPLKWMQKIVPSPTRHCKEISGMLTCL